MSQSPSESKPKKTGYRWLWVLLALFCVVPVMMIVGLIGLYMLRSQATFHDIAARERQHAVQAWQQQEATRTITTQSTPVLPPVAQAPKKRPHVVRIQLDFEDFNTRFANAITVDRDAQGSRLMVPSAVFAPMSGKINGRIVTRTAGTPKIVEVSGESWPGGGMGMSPMTGTTMGGSPAVAGIAIPGIGLTELTLNNWDLTPIRVIGDFPEASVGDKLNVVSLPEDIGFAREVTVLGLDESVQLADGSKLDHLLKLTESTGTIGALVTNNSGDPIGQIIFTTSGKLRYSYAVPMNRIFQAIYEHKQQENSSLPIKSEPRQALDVRTLPPALTDDPLAPIAGAELPSSPPPVSSTGPRLEDPLSPVDFSPTREPFRADASPPDLSPVAPLRGASPGPTNLPQATEMPPADASRPEHSPDRETQVYQVLGFAPDVAETLRSLYGDVAKIAVDSGSRSIIAIAPTTVQDKIATMIKELNTRTQNLQDERAKALQLADERRNSEFQQAQAQQNENYAKEAASNRKLRTRVIKVTGREPQEVAKVLSTKFGETADVEIDERTGSVLITVNRAKTLAEVQFLMTEIEATATRLMEEASAVTATEFSPEAVSRLKSPGMIASPVAEARQQVQLYSEQDREAKQLALQLRTATPSDQPALRARLERLTEQQFRVRQDLRKKEIDDLGNRIDQLRVTQLRRQQNQAEIIRRRVDELLDPNSDLRWEQSQVNTEPPAETVAAMSSGEAELTPKTTVQDASNIEPTFDGVAYSQWLKMLETERKPEKLAAAMDACSRTAPKADTARIAKEIIRKAILFEGADDQGQPQVWSAADASLARFNSAEVYDELLKSLHAPEAAEHDRFFQGRFILNHFNAIHPRSREWVAGLLEAVRERRKDRDCLLTAACTIWQASDLQLDDFEGLKPLVMERFDSAVEATTKLDDDWYFVAGALVLKNPDMPDLALKLMKYSARNAEFVRMTDLVGQLGRYAEPAVPAIVEELLAELKTVFANEDIDRLNSLEEVNRALPRATQLVRTLGQIGVGDRAAALLNELSLIADLLGSRPEVSPVFRVSREARAAIKKFSHVPDAVGSPILGDELRVRGLWHLHSINFELLSDYEVKFSRGSLRWLKRTSRGPSGIQIINDHRVSGDCKLEPTKTPKEIVLTSESSNPVQAPKWKRNGIYELTDTTLKIYLAPLNEPGPTEMIPDASSVREGYSLIELRRSLSMPTSR